MIDAIIAVIVVLTKGFFYNISIMYNYLYACQKVPHEFYSCCYEVFNVRKNWILGFFGFFGILGIRGLVEGDYIQAIWIVWFIWFINFIPKRKS